MFVCIYKLCVCVRVCVRVRVLYLKASSVVQIDNPLYMSLIIMVQINLSICLSDFD